MSDDLNDRAAAVIREEVSKIFFLGLDESAKVAQALRDAGCLVDPAPVWDDGFEAGREMARRWGHAEWWTLGEEPANPFRAE